MMGLFGVSSPFDSEVEKATDENNTSEKWGLILDICDKASKSPEDAKNCLKALFKRLNNSDPHIAIQAATVLDACVSNCGKVFHVEVASRTFEDEYCKLLKKAHVQVAQKLKESLKKWAEGEFKTDTQLNLIPTLYVKLKNSGVDFSTEMPTKKTVMLSKDPNVVQSQDEQDQIAKAIELSLKETSGSPKAAAGPTSSLYPTNLGSSGLGMTVSGTGAVVSAAAPIAKEARKVRALYDFEAAEDNELTFSAGEIILVIDDSDANWWKGSNQRGEGLFPANFVTYDLSVEPEQLILEKAKKMSQTTDSANTKEEKEPEEVEINEEKVDRLMHLLHEADPTNAEHDSAEMLKLEREVVGMGPLIDTELERVDRKHAQLTQLSADLVEALNLYHTLMREPPHLSAVNKLPYGYPQNTQPPSVMYNGQMPSSVGMPSYVQSYGFPQGPVVHDRQYMQGPTSIMPLPPGLPPPRQIPQGSLPPHMIMQNLTGPPGSNYAQQPQSVINYGPSSIPPGFPPSSGSQVTHLSSQNTTQPQSGHYPTSSNGHVM